MGGDSSAPTLVEVFGNEKAEWEINVRYCATLWYRRNVEALMKRVKQWYDETFTFVLIKDADLKGNLEVYIAKKHQPKEFKGGSVYSSTSSLSFASDQSRRSSENN